MAREEIAHLVSKVWGMCTPLRDDGVSSGDYLEQLTYLLFLKLAQEYETAPYGGAGGALPDHCTWSQLRQLEGAELKERYQAILEKLSRQEGALGLIFRGAVNKISSDAILQRIVQMIDNQRWTDLAPDVKGAVYEALLEKNAQDVKSGAGQYFTPRTLIWAMVQCLAPQPGQTIGDPCCGTGGFFLAAQDFLIQNNHLSQAQRQFLAGQTFYGSELVGSTFRLCLMNLYLHGIGAPGSPPEVTLGDALAEDPGVRLDCVLTNPPFGKKTALTFTNEGGEGEKLTYRRPDFWVPSSNKQLNFLQHIHTLLKPGGQGAVVVPDNVLFEAGAGEAVRRKLLEENDLHTILRLPTGIFYKPGVKANILFFEKGPGKKTEFLWVYDLRTNLHFTLKQHPMTRKDLGEFVSCYCPENRAARQETWSADHPDGRWKRFRVEELLARDRVDLDLSWIRNRSQTDWDSLSPPEELAEEMEAQLQKALAGLQELRRQLE